MAMKVLVIVPTYNEAENIDELVELIEGVAKKQRAYRFTILIVDDKSPDGTAKRVKLLQKKYTNIHLLSGDKSGLGKAYIRGYKYALKNGDYDVFVMMDADLSHNPRYIPLLLKRIDEGFDYVIGSRYTPGGSVAQDWPFSRKVISHTANFAARKLTAIDSNVNDLTGGFKALRVSSLKSIDLDSLNVKGYIFQVSLLHLFLSKGCRVAEVPIIFTERKYGQSKLQTRDILEFAYKAYKLNPNAPIQKFVRFGSVGTSGAIINLFVLTIFVKLFHIEVLTSDLVAIEISIISNFFFNHFYTFKGYGSYDPQRDKEQLHALLLKLSKFNIGALGGAAISFLSFSFFFKYVRINYIVSDVLSICIAMSWNYFISTKYVWKTIDEKTV
jgi:dolichol-phosphate mannosyltransferase